MDEIKKVNEERNVINPTVEENFNDIIILLKIYKKKSLNILTKKN